MRRTAAHDDHEPVPAIGYIRVSMAREEMISPDLQRNAIRNWARRTGHRIVDWVEDLDKSGRNFKRQIMKVIERVENGEAQVIAVWKYSRFGRTRHGVAVNLARVEDAGAQLLSATEEVDASTAVGRLQRGVIMEFNAYESDRAGEQWSETMQWRRDHGLPAGGGQRFGYIWHRRIVHQPDGTIRLQQERYEPDPELAPVVQDLYQRYVAGEGFQALATRLNRDGIRTTRGGTWSSTVLRAYLDSGFAAGYLRVHDPKCKVPYKSSCPRHLHVRVGEHGHEPVITEELWRRYLARRGDVQAMAPRSRKATYPLTGLVVCGLCGYKVKREHRGPYRPRQYVYMCRMRRDRGPSVCVGTGMPVVACEEAVRAWLAEIADGVHLAAVDAAPGIEVRARKESAQALRERLAGEVARVDRAIARHMRVYALAEEEDPSGDLEAQFLLTLRELRKERAEFAAELDGIAEEESGAGEQLAAVPVAQSLLEEWGGMPPDGLNALLRGVVSAVVLLPGGGVRVIPAWDAEPVFPFVQ